MAAVELDRRWKPPASTRPGLPYVRLAGSDAHWLRIGTSPGRFSPVRLPEDGSGWGYQIDSFLSYRVNDLFSVGLGGPLLAHAGERPHPFRKSCGRVSRRCRRSVNWKTDNYGVFLQSSVKLGPARAVRWATRRPLPGAARALRATSVDGLAPRPAEGDTSRVDSTA